MANPDRFAGRIWPRAQRGARGCPQPRAISPSAVYLILFSPLCPHPAFENRTGSTIFTTHLDSPVGLLHLAASDSALLAVVWRRHSTPQLAFDTAIDQPDHPVLRATAEQLDQYFSGGRRAFDLPLEFRGTEFQRRVWSALLDIPWGETRSYLDVARTLGNPAAVRAVGAANGRNPISIIAPCHRVIGASGDLTGFGGGMEAKAWLLAHESPQRDLLAAS